jgi:hypothetical protein
MATKSCYCCITVALAVNSGTNDYCENPNICFKAFLATCLFIQSTPAFPYFCQPKIVAIKLWSFQKILTIKLPMLTGIITG